jgi:site-specific recombinase XerD
MSKDAAPLGAIVQSFFIDHLVTVKGLRPASIRSYRDTTRLLLVFAAADKGCRITRLRLEDLTFERVVAFLRHLEVDRDNHIRTRNQRLAAIHTLHGPHARLTTRSKLQGNNGDHPTTAHQHFIPPGWPPDHAE